MDEIRRLATNGIDASFLSNAEKAALYSAFQREWADWDANHK
jgi:adenosine deaminase